MSEHQSALEKEFELERLILFSDAVFAIAITLSIIEIKFPEVEKGAAPMEILLAFKPAIIRFVAFAFSFAFIGITWARHLQLFRFLKRFDKGLMVRNLLLLFFIVCFPFTVSGITEHIRPNFLLPLIIYMANLAGVSCAQLALTHYMLYKKPQLCALGMETEKRYYFLKSKWTTLIFISVFISYITLLFFFGQNSLVPVVAFYPAPVLLIVMRRKLKKYKPEEV